MKTVEKTKMDEFEKLLEESFSQSYNVADIVEGTVITKEQDGYLVSIKGAKTEAILPNREVPSAAGEENTALEVGDVKEFYVLREENDDEPMLLSLKRIACAQAWMQLNDAKISGDTILAKVISLVKGGVLVDVADLKGFIPSSQLRTGTPFDGLIDQKIEVKVLEADPKKNKLILSQRQAVADQRDQVVDDVLASLSEDMVVKGEVVRIADFGAFVDINGIDGLLPISEISWQRIKHPSDIISLGEKIEVKIIKIDNELKRISLSLKRMGENPWQQIEGEFKEGQIINGTVNKITSFGAFINIFPGVEALLPVAEMSNENVNPFNLFKVGDEVKVLIKKFTPQEHRIALSIKDIQE
ncbi:MAG TPA: S1 RNA-binding domain-containing protein [Candidatus Gastranaerophilaceae bacterium]|nr:S1 RNA-binding domain-containing protein [Candidatus Gastranaerophilaceae bacterium]HPT40898.1 S1 RNA-binding domain-containing protein [Candidatus Gastranaerophilaceae bacterium]